MSGSVVVLASAIDSVLDMIISLFNMFAIKNAQKAVDEEYNYGRGKIEGLASLFEGIIIILSGFFIIYQAIHNLIEEKPIAHLDYAMGVMVVSIVLTGFLVLFLNSVAKKTNNMVIKADALHYKSDLYTNIGIIVSLALIHLTGLAVIDAVVSMMVALYIIVKAYELVKESYWVLMDRALEEEMVQKIRQVLDGIRGMSSYHYLRTRRSAHFNAVDVHLVFDEKISLKDAHVISDEVEARIRALDPHSGWYFNVHLDPRDDSIDYAKAIEREMNAGDPMLHHSN